MNNRSLFYYVRVASVLAFVVSLVLLSNFLLELPSELSTAAQHPDEFILRLYAYVGATLIFALANILMLVLAGRTTQQNQIVYIEKRQEGSTQEATAEAQTAQVQEDETMHLLDSTQRLIQHLQEVSAQANPLQRPEQLLQGLCKHWEAVQGVFYVADHDSAPSRLHLVAGYAWFHAESRPPVFEWGEGLVGQVARTQEALYVKTLPEGYVTVLSGLGTTKPNALVILPLIAEGKTLGVVELSLFRALKRAEERQLVELGKQLGPLIADLQATALIQQAELAS
ncbi:GAF domain-containing protein [Catalinimonas alkaloidigena]|uniref:GAF domain-containing protein n=1 Tax=Catalinimonas alkaloidigena TaxID=1075417 RepID=A0A1G8Y1E5_9BACT|nr:GAF domain-containing protein [Catalinimonas alkaloidigena]SDJ96669.1 GAF domain-containing protein [Catalinimonas alkaloidigena]